jgi:deazaflavin-dependent oxidoreductase (nitroreductase family)
MPDDPVWNRHSLVVLAVRGVFAFHQAAYRATGGLVGHRLGPISCLLLTTQGSRTGQARTLPLLYGRDGENLILVASKGGSPKHPAWYVNLQAHPEAVAQVGSRDLWVTARTATAAERPRLWKLMTREYRGYDGYQQRTDREIPIVILEPVRGGDRAGKQMRRRA